VLTATTPVTIVASEALVTRTITYTYDSLYRLTEADYSSGESFQYDYDAANRLITVTMDGVTRTLEWSDAGELLRDGTDTYTWDAAGRLASATVDGVTSYYAYLGNGARISTTMGSETTTYTLDLAVPLVQVLVASQGSTATAYLYGVARIGEDDGDWQYHLTDHPSGKPQDYSLGSVRTLAGADGSVGATRAYRPYGTPLHSAGGAASRYGFTGEQTDATGLVYLRARMYAPSLEVFLSRDPWSGNAQQPLSFNGYSWVEGNPINRVDPSGLLSNSAIAKSFGKDNFDDVIRVFATNRHWGLLAALQDASVGDVITFGAFGTGSTLVRFEVKCKNGLIYLDPSASSFLSPYRRFYPDMTLAAIGQVLQDQNTIKAWAVSRMFPVWRLPNRWNWFFLNDGGGRSGRGYPDDWRTTVMPDFKFGTQAIGLEVGGGYHRIVDRYGNRYEALTLGPAFGVAIIAFSEGYAKIGPGPGGRDIPNESELKGLIQGWSVGADAAVYYGQGAFVSRTDNGALIYSLGMQVFVGGGVTRTEWKGKDTDLAWDWVDRELGYKESDIRRERPGELEICDECSNYCCP
jgi:RHS repeat-associated protein